MPEKKKLDSGKPVSFSVVGANHRITFPTRDAVADALPLRVVLMRETGNRHDANAIKVVVRQDPFKGLHLGYLPRGVAEVYAEPMDLERVEVIKARLVEFDPEAGSGTIKAKVVKHKGIRK